MSQIKAKERFKKLYACDERKRATRRNVTLSPFIRKVKLLLVCFWAHRNYDSSKQLFYIISPGVFHRKMQFDLPQSSSRASANMTRYGSGALRGPCGVSPNLTLNNGPDLNSRTPALFLCHPVTLTFSSSLSAHIPLPEPRGPSAAMLMPPMSVYLW